MNKIIHWLADQKIWISCKKIILTFISPLRVYLTKFHLISDYASFETVELSSETLSSIANVCKITFNWVDLNGTPCIYEFREFPIARIIESEVATRFCNLIQTSWIHLLLLKFYVWRISIYMCIYIRTIVYSRLQESGQPDKETKKGKKRGEKRKRYKEK